LVLEKNERIVVVGEAANGRQLLALAERERPDVVLTDVVMPIMDGVAAAKAISESVPEAGVIALSMFGDDAHVMDMIEAGALGYLIKNADKEEIYSAIEAAYKKQPYYCKSTSTQLAKLIIRTKHKMNEQVIQFSDKELQIIRGICEEMSNEEMSKELYISKRTIDGYRSRILEKLDVKSSIGIVKYAIRMGIYKL